MTAAESAETFYEFYQRLNLTEAPLDQVSIKQAFEDQAALCPEAIAVACESDRLTYRSLNERANGLADRLLRCGVLPGDTVGVSVPRSTGLVIALIAIIKCGAAYVPFDLGWPGVVRENIIHHGGVKCMIYDNKKQRPASGSDYASIFLDDLTPDLAGRNPSVEISADDLAYIIFTSGSTGTPKGVKIRHRGVLRLVNDARYARFDSTSVVLHLASTTFDAATFEIWGPLLNGGTCAIYAGRHVSISGIEAIIRNERINCIFLTTALFNAVVTDAPEVIADVNTILFGGEQCSLKHVKKALAVYGQGRVVHVYGPTECTTFATYYPVNGVPSEWSTVPIGKPIQNTKLYVLKDGELCAPGDIGEIVLGGAGISSGYIGDTDENARFKSISIGGVKEDVYFTGDLGHLTEDADLIFDGRADSQVKVNGFRVELSGISLELERLESVRNSYITVTDGVAGERCLTAFVACSGNLLSSIEVRDHLSRHLPAYMVPSIIKICDRLPLLGNGKVDRQSLLRQAEAPAED